MRWLRIATVIVGILMLGAWAAGSYLLGREEVPAESNYRLDVAWHLDQIRNLHYRPRLVTDINLVASHDIDQHDIFFRTGQIGRRFEAVVP